MDATQQRAAGFVLPGEDPDELVSAAQSAMAIIPQQNALIVNLQGQNQQMQQMVQQSKDMVTAMMLQAKDLQAQVTTARFVPVLSQMIAYTGVLTPAPSDAMTSFSMTRELTSEGGVTEQVTITFDPVGLTEAKGEAQATINHSQSIVSKVTKAFGPSR